VITTFSITYLTLSLHAKTAVALNAVLIGSFAEMLTLPLFAALSDRIGRRPVYAAGAAGMAIWGFAFFGLLRSGDAWLVTLAMVGGLVCHGAMYGPQAAFISELFPTRFRYSGASIAYQLTSVFAGSLAPIIALWLLQLTHATLAISIYVALCCAVSVFAALRARETSGDTYAQIDARSAP
jgi:MFS family permease